MELKLQNGDYVPDGLGGVVRGTEERGGALLAGGAARGGCVLPA